MSKQTVTLFFCGDVMTGRGIDQILPDPVDPILYERHMTGADGYVTLAEEKNGNIDTPVDYSYVWGDALKAFERFKPDIKIANLETSITSHDIHREGKGIHYRMSPGNVQALTYPGIDLVALANNHLLDWGREGLAETISVLNREGVEHAGAGENRSKAEDPALFELNTGDRVIMLSFGTRGSGIPDSWAATENRSGVYLLPDFSSERIQSIKSILDPVRKPGDVIVVSVHWGPNWDYRVPDRHRWFAHQLIEEAGVDVIHGHSSHHPKGIEVFRGKLILYGAGDFINDYEGIKGHEEYRGDLRLMYFPILNKENGKLNELHMVPLQTYRFRLQKASQQDTSWLASKLDNEGNQLGTAVSVGDTGLLYLDW